MRFWRAAWRCCWRARRARADEIPKKYRPNVEAGLKWLAEKQTVSDDKKEGYWSAGGAQHKVAMTALAGMALLMEGSTIKDGKYSKQIERAVNFLMRMSQKGNQRDGLIADFENRDEATRYMYGHGFAVMFLASVYGDEGNAKRRAELKDVIARGVKYIGNAQSTQGGWYYTSKADGHDSDEGSVTVTQMQALRAARNAGIPVPRDFVKKAQDYLKHSTTERGGVVYSLGRGGMKAPAGGERPPLTAAAIACFFSAGDFKKENNEYVIKWFKYCKDAIPINGGGVRFGHDEYTHYYYAQAVYMLGDTGWEKLFGQGKGDEKVTWTAYRAQLFDRLVQMQSKDGSWSQGGYGIGPVYTTALYLTVMQLDKGTLPIYQR